MADIEDRIQPAIQKLIVDFRDCIPEARREEFRLALLFIGTEVMSQMMETFMAAMRQAFLSTPWGHVSET